MLNVIFTVGNLEEGIFPKIMNGFAGLEINLNKVLEALRPYNDAQSSIEWLFPSTTCFRPEL